MKTHAQQFLLYSVGLIHKVVFNLRRCDYGNEQTVRIYEKAIQLIKLLFEDGDYGAQHFQLFGFYAEIALAYAKMNDADACIENLNIAAHHAIKYDALLEGLPYTSLLFSELKTQRNGKTYMSNEAQNMLKKMATEHFDFCRNDERFVELENKLARTAGDGVTMEKIKER